MDTVSARSLAGMSSNLLSSPARTWHGEFRLVSQQIPLISSYHVTGSNTNNSTSVRTSFFGERSPNTSKVAKGQRRSRPDHAVVSVLKGDRITGSRDVQAPDDVESLKAALAAAEARTDAAKQAEKKALDALAAMKNKSRDMAQNDQNSQEVFEGISLAVQVEKISESTIQKATLRITEDAELKIAAAETAAAEVILELEDQFRRAAEDAVQAASVEAQVTIDEARAAVSAARVQAEKSEAILNKQVKALNELAEAEAKVLMLEEALLDAGRKLQLANGETERIRIELDSAQRFIKTATARAEAAERTAEELQRAAAKEAEERADSAQSAINAVKKATQVRLDADKIAFEAELDALRSANDTSHKASEARRLVDKSRFELLERSLLAVESATAAWKNRALMAEKLLRLARINGAEIDTSSLPVEQAPSVGRLEVLPGSDVRIKDLLENGPRRETPDWMKRRLQIGQQVLPPMQPIAINADVDALIPLQLPSSETVWDVSKSKVKENDKYAVRAAEKEALDLQRNAMERALQTKSIKTLVRYPEDAEEKSESGTGSGREIVFQGFNWESWRRQWWLEMSAKASDLSKCGITTIWLPPPTHSVAPQGYMPGDLYNLNSAYGGSEELKQCIDEMHKHNILVLGDVVLNHRCAQKQSPNGVWNRFGGKLNWGPEAIVRDDPNFQGQGNPKSGDFFHAAPNIDHSQDFVRRDIIEWMKWLRSDFGFDGWRLDFVRGFWGGYVKEYIEATKPAFAIGEYWDSLAYEGGQVSYNQDAHRQRIVNWINAAGGTSSAFDVTTKGILHSALHGEFWRLIDPQGKPPGVMGWWPSRAVTFLENHDTGSTQGHWPFPRDKLMMGYAYILTHPGTPVIFHDHFYDFGLHDQIADLIAVRTRTGVHCRSKVKIFQANFEGYAAQVGDNLVMKIGHLDWNPSKQNNLAGSWNRCTDKGEYQLWERK
ncbi:uncharacterized protein [Physcomitrium patens]|uniref:alpha-amylase n=1 Tax=Physcomitrium patens TaxID=3218 RepID=A0A2K1IPB7_PHYPA|nr:uncharacterized protein LOC112275023 [Physcomitrium patens]XP_024360716.1 uncharacterized protein LOC112275023 [Physcomitrium patens]PNR31125.1 hypothetical protein PHYPA_027442 [Physcomitrium patens]|eukprot:XP_024360714.1 uncharacterized protein LOC112275023 [Physcomitrella patens]